jgi:ABC-type uncharacterized transport system fused permease/ATPase subunit
VRQSIFRKPLFARPLDRQFWWIGASAVGIGIGLGMFSLIMSAVSWPIERLWFWLLISAMCIVIGVQLMISWFVMRTLEELSQRDGKTESDLRGSLIK